MKAPRQENMKHWRTLQGQMTVTEQPTMPSSASGSLWGTQAQRAYSGVCRDLKVNDEPNLDALPFFS